jgi:hypothetical protein
LTPDDPLTTGEVSGVEIQGARKIRSPCFAAMTRESVMKNDQVKTSQEISAEDLEKISGGMTKTDLNAIRLQKEILPLPVEGLQNIKGLEPDPWEKPL